MSYEVIAGDEELGQFASNQGYHDLIEAIRGKDYPELERLFADGETGRAKRCAAELRTLAESGVADSVRETALGLASMIADKKNVVLTDGVIEEDVEPTEKMGDDFSDLPEDILDLPGEAHEVFRGVLKAHSGNSLSEIAVYVKAYRALEDAGYEIHKDLTVSDVHVNKPIGAVPTAPKKKRPLDVVFEKADVVAMNVPLLIRILEVAREEIEADEPLHKVAERLIELSRKGTPLTMEDYDSVMSVLKYDPDQPRDSQGRWGEGGGELTAAEHIVAQALANYVEYGSRAALKNFTDLYTKFSSGDHSEESKVIQTIRDESRALYESNQVTLYRGVTGDQEYHGGDLQVNSLSSWARDKNEASFYADKGAVIETTVPKISVALDTRSSTFQKLIQSKNLDHTVDEVFLWRPLGKVPGKVAKSDGEDIAKRISGNSDIPLNGKGTEMAKELGERLKAKGGLDTLMSSPLKRAVETADAIREAGAVSGEVLAPSDGLCPWHLGKFEGEQGSDVRDELNYFIEHPNERPPGKGADGETAETFDEAKARQLDFLVTVYEGWNEDLEQKVGMVMHSRGMELLKSWVGAGCPANYELDEEDVLHPDDPEHATVVLWHGDDVDEVDLESDDTLKPGVYLILHSLTDDDSDAGNEDLEQEDGDDGGSEGAKKGGREKVSGVRGGPEGANVRKYLPPVEVHRAAKRAWDAGTSVIGITSILAEGAGIGIEEVRQIAGHFREVAKTGCPESLVSADAWGGTHAASWVERVFKRAALDGEVAKAGNGVMLAFWPDAATQKKLAVAGGEAPEDIHLTLAYFGKPEEVEPGCLEALDHWLKAFCAAHAPVSGVITGIGIFPATPQSDGKDVAYRGFHSDAVQEFRRELVEASEAAGCKPRKNFGYNPHVTLKYLSPSAPHLLGHPENIDVTFDKVVLSAAGKRTEYPLTEEPVGTLAEYVAAKYDPDQPRDDNGQWGSGGAESVPEGHGDFKAARDPAGLVNVKTFRRGDMHGDQVSTPISAVTPAEQSSLGEYKAFGFAKVNSYLMTGKAANENVRPMAKDVAAVMTRTTLAENATIYRGVNGPLAAKLGGLSVGDTGKLPCYQSTTTSLTLAKEFARGEKGEAARTGTPAESPTVLHFDVPKGYGALPIAKLSGYADTEKELLLNKGGSFRVTGKVTSADGTTHIRLAVIK